MAVLKINTYLYIGLSGDTKTADAPAEARFVETDTGKEFVKAQDGNWYDVTLANRVSSGGSSQVGAPSTITDTGSFLAVFSPLLVASVGVEVTRPSDTNAYLALDAVSNSTSAPAVITFAGMARRNGAGGTITKARLVTDQKTNVARFRLHLFDTAPTPINDNSPYLHLYANNAIREGMIDFPANTTEDPTNSTAASSLNNYTRLPYICAAGDTTLYGLLETLDAFTPASAQKIYVELLTELN